MSRAKKIAAIIVGDVWPGVFTDSWTYRKIENAVERHMLRPHQVKDHVGIIWEQMSDGCYRTLNGAKTDYIDRNFGPLTTIQGEPLPDAGEIERLKKQIAELERQLAEAKPEPAKPLTAKDHIEAAIDQLWADYAEEVKSKSIDLKANYTRVIGTLMDVIDDMGAPS